MAQAIPLIVAGAQAASGVVSYISSNRQAQQLRQNAGAVKAKAEYDAAVAFNNALEQKQQVAFEGSQVEANRNRILLQGQQEREKFTRASRQKVAEAEVKFGYGGTSESYISSLEDEAFQAENSFLLDLSDKTTSASLQLTEFSRQQNILAAKGVSDKRNILYGGEVEANSLRAQADQASTAGVVNLLGSFASAGTSYKTLKK